jgi:DNA-binding NarL/FixJ family response regulator
VAAVADLLAPQDPADQSATPLGSLTKAELAVSQLVAEGLTSRQIAEKLFVSPRTVDAHLSHIFRKLEIASRAKLAALMAEIA